jgi:predicted DsbA family dithiol-disulfide isomerase
MYNDVTRIIARNGWMVDVEYVQDIDRIMSYGVMATPVLVIEEKVVMVGHHGSSKIEQVLRTAIDSQVAYGSIEQPAHMHCRTQT